MKKEFCKYLGIISGALIMLLIGSGQTKAAIIRRNVAPPTAFNSGILVNNGSTLFGQTNIFGRVNLSGNSLDFGQGGSKIEDNGDLTLATDNYLFLNASSRVNVKNDLRVKGQLQLTQGDQDNGSTIYDNGDLVIFSNDTVKLNSKKKVEIQSDALFHGGLQVNGVVELPSGSVVGDSITDGSITTAKLADGAVTTAKLADDSVNSIKVVNGSIVNEDISSLAGIGLSKLASTTSGYIIVANGSGVPTYVPMSGDTTIATTGVITISPDAVTSGKIADGSILNGDINAAAGIVYSKLNIADGDLTIAKTAGLQAALDSKLALAGGTMTGNIDLGGNDITGVNIITANSFNGKATDSDLLDGHDSLYFEVAGTASGLMITHEATYDHSLIATALQSESDPIFLGSAVAGVTTADIGNWNTAWGWGDHAGLYDLVGTASGLVGAHESTYNHGLIATALQSESDPIFSGWNKSTGISITESQVSDLQTYLTDLSGLNTDNLSEGATNKYFSGFTEIDPIFSGWNKSTGISITESQVSDLQTYLTSEDDPIFLGSAVAGVTTADIGNWNTAWGWGDHNGLYLPIDGKAALAFTADTATKVPEDVSDISATDACAVRGAIVIDSSNEFYGCDGSAWKRLDY